MGLLGLWVFRWWFAVDCGGGFAVSEFFFFFILRCSKHCKIFSDYFPKYKQTPEKQSFSLKSFTFTNILRWRMFYVETNGALIFSSPSLTLSTG